MEEYIKLLEGIEKDILWHLFQCKRGAISNVNELNKDMVKELQKAKKSLNAVLTEVEAGIHHPSEIF